LAGARDLRLAVVSELERVRRWVSLRAAGVEHEVAAGNGCAQAGSQASAATARATSASSTTTRSAATSCARGGGESCGDGLVGVQGHGACAGAGTTRTGPARE